MVQQCCPIFQGRKVVKFWRSNLAKVMNKSGRTSEGTRIPCCFTLSASSIMLSSIRTLNGWLGKSQEERDNAQRSYVIDLPAAQISDFPNHPFKVRMARLLRQNLP